MNDFPVYGVVDFVLTPILAIALGIGLLFASPTIFIFLGKLLAWILIAAGTIGCINLAKIYLRK